MRRILATMSVLVLVCAPAIAGPNSNGAIIVHTNDSYTYLSATVCETSLGQPASCGDANTRIDGRGPAVVWFLAAFYPAASPVVASVYFGVDFDEAELNPGAQFGVCGPPGSLEVPDAGWPARDAGNTVGFGSPIVANVLFRFYYFQIENLTGGPPLTPQFCSRFNPTGGYAAFYDDSFPPKQDFVSLFGCVKWYDTGHNDCPGSSPPPSGACCLTTGSCVLVTREACEATQDFLQYRGDDTLCLPDNPCPQPGACCNMTTGSCTFGLWTTCSLPDIFIGGACEPQNPCPHKGACCEPLTGNCTFVMRWQCSQPSSLWHSDETCEPNNCQPGLAACCDYTGACTLTTESECVFPGIWHPEWPPCEPNNCPPSVEPATEPTTWGRIKATFR